MPHWAEEVRVKITRDSHAVPFSLREDVLRLCGIVETLPTYKYRRQEFSVFEEAADTSNTLNDLAHVIEGVGESCGFTCASLFLIRTGTAVKFDTRVCTSLPRQWLLRYDRQNYQFIDPVISRTFTRDEPFAFSELPPPAPVVEEFWKDAEAHGVGRQGCGFVHTIGDGIRIGLSFTSTDSAEEALAAYRDNRYDLEAFGRVAAEIFVTLAAVLPTEDPRPSVEELRYLKRLVDAPPGAELDTLVNSNTYEAVRKTLCYRLGVATVFQALVVMNRHPWQDDLPFDGLEIVKTYPGILEHPTPLCYAEDQSPIILTTEVPEQGHPWDKNEKSSKANTKI